MKIQIPILFLDLQQSHSSDWTGCDNIVLKDCVILEKTRETKMSYGKYKKGA